jgi:hypothetical protein
MDRAVYRWLLSTEAQIRSRNMTGQFVTDKGAEFYITFGIV